MLTVALAALRARWATFVGSFVALALGVGLIAAMGLGIGSTFDVPERAPERFASSPVVVMGTDSLTVDGLSRKLFHPHPVDTALLRELRALGPLVNNGGLDKNGGLDAVGVQAPAADVRRLVGDRAQVLTGDERRRADPDPERDAEALVAVNSLLGAAVTAVNLAGLGAALASLSAPVTITVPWRAAGLALGACAAVAVLAALLSCPRPRR